MKKLFTFESCLLALVGMVLVFVLAFSTRPLKMPRSYVYDYSKDIRFKGQVKSATTESAVTFTEISPKDVLDTINNNTDTILVDVSTLYKSGHIPTAINIPLKEIDKLVLGMDKNKTYIVYCRNNTDSLVAIQKLVNYGFQKIFRLSGGYNSWISSKYKIEK